MLSPFMYFKNNKKSAAVIISILSLAVFCISYITTLISSVYTTSKIANTSPFQCFSVVTYTGNTPEESKQSLLEQVNDKNNDVYDIYLSFASIKTVFGTTSAYLLYFDDQDSLQDVFNKCDMELIEGELPHEGKKELILHKNILKNKNLTVGDVVNEFTISGSFDGNINMGLGYMTEDMKQAFQYQNPSYLIYPLNNTLENLNENINKLNNKNWNIFTYPKLLENLDEEFETTNLILLIVVVMMSICLSIAVSALLFAVYTGRYNEFAILNAIGYKKSSIKKMIMLENLILSVFSWTIGFGISILSLYLTNSLIYEEMGQQMEIVTTTSICYTLLLPIIAMTSTLLPVIRKLSKIDLISIIERR